MVRNRLVTGALVALVGLGLLASVPGVHTSSCLVGGGGAGSCQSASDGVRQATLLAVLGVGFVLGGGGLVVRSVTGES